ncbi:MAG: hypothetical protein ABH859_07160 [Pseudomonadota bacterium]
MLGMIGIIGCVAATVTAVIAGVSAAVSIANMAYQIDAANDAEALDEEQRNIAEENARRDGIRAEADQKKARLQAQQMAASGMALDQLNAHQDKLKETKARREINRPGQNLQARSYANYGSPSGSAMEI